MKKKKTKKKHFSNPFHIGIAGLIALLCLMVWVSSDAYLQQLHEPMEEAFSEELSVGDIIAPMVEHEEDTFVLTFEDELPEPISENRQENNTAIYEDRHQIALIIDDVGYDLKALRRLLALPYTLTVSILPDAPYAKQAAQMAYQHGAEVMLHMPMQTTNPKYQNKMEKYYLHQGMSKAVFTQVFEDALAKVPHAQGVNNHMGSALTENAQSMQWLMELCQKNNLFFIDSRTSSKSVGATTAEASHIAWNQRDIFLDHSVEKDALQHAWQSTLSCAKRNDHCIMLAHPHQETLAFLEHGIASEDFSRFVSINSVLK